MNGVRTRNVRHCVMICTVVVHRCEIVIGVSVTSGRSLIFSRCTGFSLTDCHDITDALFTMTLNTHYTGNTPNGKWE